MEDYRIHRKGPERDTPSLLWIKAWCDIEGECWIWSRSRNSKGYGKLKIKKRIIFVHRYVYTLVHGPIPSGLQVMHSCDVRLCCNPDHLSTGTNDDNVRDMIAKGRGFWQKSSEALDDEK